ncbi:MAG: precorrin-2 C(20)-methyltransferase [Halanaerobium sp.]
MANKLYGIGVGVGDSGLVTLKAVKILKEVDYICTPLSAKSDSSRALEIISSLVDLKDRVVKLEFKMSKNKQDPFLYSTYSYMLENIKRWDNSIKFETVPGINSIAAVTSEYNLPLAEGKENTAILSDLKDEEHLEKVFNLFETVVILKLSRNFDTAYRVLEKLGLKSSVLIASKCGFEDEFYTKNIEIFKSRKIEYLTLMIVKRKGI